MLPYFLTASLYMLLRTYALGGVMQGKEIDLTMYDALINVFPLIARYVGKLFVPVGLSAVYSYDMAHSITEPGVIVGFLAALAVFVILFLVRMKKTVFFFLCWIFVPLLPVLYIPAVSVGGFADRYLYLSTAGFAVILGVVVLRIISMPVKGGVRDGERRGEKSRKVSISVAAAALGLLAVYSAASVGRSRVWRNDYNLWSDAVIKSPGSANAHYNLGWALHREARYDRAEAEYKKALDITPDKEKAHYNLALIYNEKGDYVNAVKHFKESIRLKPASIDAYAHLAIIYHKTGRVSDAVYLYKIALRLEPENDDIQYNLARAYQDRGDYPNAMYHYKEAVRLNPGGADAHYNMGIIYGKLNLPDRAAAEFSAALSIDPDFSAARVELNDIIYLKNKEK
ncbi:MAG: tetratricopeptide repeat protein, partial [Thermodesulfobacteriota bacterium]